MNSGWGTTRTARRRLRARWRCSGWAPRPRRPRRRSLQPGGRRLGQFPGPEAVARTHDLAGPRMASAAKSSAGFRWKIQAAAAVGRGRARVEVEPAAGAPRRPSPTGMPRASKARTQSWRRRRCRWEAENRPTTLRPRPAGGGVAAAPGRSGGRRCGSRRSASARRSFGRIWAGRAARGSGGGPARSWVGRQRCLGRGVDGVDEAEHEVVRREGLRLFRGPGRDGAAPAHALGVERDGVGGEPGSARCGT